MGGAIMHQLAIDLQNNGHNVTGSDDEIFDPAKSNLIYNRLYPEALGWFPERISEDIDCVILGMHAREDNPELIKAKELNLKIYSFPEFIYEFSKDKKRIVVAGSHGKTSTTSMIMHVLSRQNIDFDYLVGAKVQGFDQSVRLSGAAIMVIEGDEYPASILEKRPKIHFYHPHISILTGIEWDHINVFPTYENYVDQFKIYLETMGDDSHLIYCREDEEVVSLVAQHAQHLQSIAYGVPVNYIEDDQVIVSSDDGEFPVSVFGAHNLMNMEAAWQVCRLLGISNSDFFKSISDFTGAAKRLEKIYDIKDLVVYRDFAHAPSKLRATMKAARERYPLRKLVACFELHTYSSLNEAFLHQYKDTLSVADEAIVYISEHALSIKKMSMIEDAVIKDNFNDASISVLHHQDELNTWIKDQIKNSDTPICLMMMSSGTFDGWKIENII